MAKLLHCGSMICPTRNAAGIARNIPRRKLRPICAPFSRLANRLQTTQVSTRPPGAEGQAVASQKPLITRKASALREPNSKASDQSRCAASPWDTSLGALPASTSSSAWLAAMA
ncbi:hypothetical protein D3C80_980910 [compost metagenome]